MSNLEKTSSLPGAFSLLNNAWQVYQQRWRIFFGIMLSPLIAALLFQLQIIFGFNNIFVAILTLLIMLISLVVQSLAQLAVMYVLKEQDINIKKAYQLAWRRLLSFWWISFISGFIVLIGFFLLLIPGMIFAVWFCLASFVLVNEDLKGWPALQKSKAYVKGRWWSVFGRLLVILLFSLIIYFVLIAISAGTALLWLGNIINLIISFLLAPFILTYSFLLYTNLRSLKEKA